MFNDSFVFSLLFVTLHIAGHLGSAFINRAQIFLEAITESSYSKSNLIFTTTVATATSAADDDSAAAPATGATTAYISAPPKKKGKYASVHHDADGPKHEILEGVCYQPQNWRDQSESE